MKKLVISRNFTSGLKYTVTVAFEFGCMNPLLGFISKGWEKVNLNDTSSSLKGKQN